MGTSQRTGNRYLVFDGVTTGIANGVSKAFASDDFRNAVIEVTASAGAALTMKVPSSNLSSVNTGATDPYPNFAAADSMANPWTYVQFIDLATGNLFDGATGVTFATAGTRQYEINTNQMKWFGLEISALTSGSIKATITFCDNR